MPGILRTIRTLLRTPGFTVAALLALGLGMGASAAIYTLIQRVVLDPLPYPHAEQLVRLKNAVPGVGSGEEWQLSLAQYVHFGRRLRSIERIGIYQVDGMNFAGAADPRRVRAARISAPVIDLIGANADIGRPISADDDQPGAARVVMLSHDFWQREFGSDRGIIGKTVRLDERPFEVIGVMAAGIELPPERGEGVPAPTDLWLPMRVNTAGPFQNNHVFPAIARMAPGATIDGLRLELAALQPELPQQFPSAYSEQFFTRYGFNTEPYPLKAYVIGDVSSRLWIVFGAVWIVLAIACANVAHLLLVRLEGRRRDLAIRTALGAGWRDLALEAFREGALLAAGGAVLALALAAAGTVWLQRLAPAGIPRLSQVSVDARVFVFVAVITALVTLAVAVIPALQLRAASHLASLGAESRGGTPGVDRRRIRQALIVSQVAMAMVLVVSAALLLRSVASLRRVDPGIDAAGVASVELFLPGTRYDSLHKAWRFDDEVLRRVRAIPGVTAAGIGQAIPLAGDDGYGCTVQGFEDKIVYDRVKEANATTCAGQVQVSPGYFQALGIPVLAGRTLTEGDNEFPATGAVVVSKAFAERFWPGENPLGKGVNANGQSEPPFYHVVGVVGDVHARSVESPPEIAIYYPIVGIPGNWRSYPGAMRLIVKTSSGSALRLIPELRRAVSDVDPSIPLANAQSLEDMVSRSMGRVTFTMTLLGIAGGIALLLAAVGLYGLLSYVVGRRTREMGVRLALGALPRQVEAMVVRDAAVLALTGVAVGLLGAIAFTRILRGLLFGVATWDPLSYAGAAAVLSLVAVASAWAPARRAARVDPSTALRQEG